MNLTAFGCSALFQAFIHTYRLTKPYQLERDESTSVEYDSNADIM